jgi:hypothetical protein
MRRIAATVPESPIEQLLRAVDALDAEAVVALSAPDVRLLTVDGRRAVGAAEMRELLSDFLEPLRSATHRVTTQWHPDEVWIAEVDASYELKDMTRLGGLPRAFIVRAGPDGLSDVGRGCAGGAPPAPTRGRSPSWAPVSAKCAWAANGYLRSESKPRSGRFGQRLGGPTFKLMGESSGVA